MLAKIGFNDVRLIKPSYQYQIRFQVSGQPEERLLSCADEADHR